MLFYVILLFVNTVLYDLLQDRLPVALYVIFDAGEASILKIYLQDKFPMGNLVNLVKKWNIDCPR
jgi:hypothetical protein